MIKMNLWVMNWQCQGQMDPIHLKFHIGSQTTMGHID